MINTISAFIAPEGERSLLTIKPQSFIDRAPCRRTAVKHRCQKMSKENWVATASISFLLKGHSGRFISKILLSFAASCYFSILTFVTFCSWKLQRTFWSSSRGATL